MPRPPDTNRWRDPPADSSVTSTEIDIWRIGLTRDPPSLSLLRATLSPDETERADRFVFPGDRDRFLGARGALREILGRYLRREPAQVAFGTTDYGKPFLGAASIADSHGLRFNLSHSGDLALCAVTRGREIGVDIERLREDFEVFEVADRFFSRPEVDALRALPEASLREGFFTCWTRKEAYIKARGEGLSMPLDRFVVSVAPGSEARLLSSQEDTGGSEEWTLRALDPGEGYVAALAVEGAGPFELRCFDWSPGGGGRRRARDG